MLLMVLLAMAQPSAKRPATAPAHRAANVRRSKATRARGNLVSLFSDQDYPTEALIANEEGTVGVRLTVGLTGRPTHCAVVQSSDAESLDRATCRVLMERARFTPSRDRRGRPMIDTYSQRVVWRIPQEESYYPALPPMPPEPLVDWLSQAIFPVTDSGLGPCRLRDDNTPSPFRIGTCADLAAAARAAMTNRPERLRTPYRLIFSLRMTVGRTADPDVFEQGSVAISRHSARLRIDAKGVLVGCEPVGDVDSIALAVLCNRARSASFEPIENVIVDAPERSAIVSESTAFVPGF